MLWYVPKTRMLPFGFTTRQTSRSHSTLNWKNSSSPKRSHDSAIVTCDENAQPSPRRLLMLNGGSAMQWSMHAAGQPRIVSSASPWISEFRFGACNASPCPHLITLVILWEGPRPPLP